MQHVSNIADLVGIIFLLLFIAAIALIASRSIRLPFTVLLVLIGVAIVNLTPFGQEWLTALEQFDGLPDVILFVLLPTLIFESAFSLNARQLKDNIWPILTLAIPGLLLSTLIIGTLIHLLSGIALAPALLLGAILSATDPVAVISLFKQLGAPKRLTVLVEGESLFNDATALVLSKILMAVVLSGYVTMEQAFGGVLTFFSVFFGGAIVGVLMAWVVGQILGFLESEPFVEVSLTTVLAYSSFVVAEHLFHVSGVMAVLAAAITMGSWGRTKISPSVNDFLHHFWEFLAYIANSLIFLMVGLRMDILGIAEHFSLFALLIVAMLVSRAIIIYGLVPILGRLPNANPISFGYKTVMYWGGLRGAIALAIVLSLPAFEYTDLFIDLVAGAVLFTLLVQGLSIEKLVRMLGLDRPPLSDRLAQLKGEADGKQRAIESATQLQAGGLFSVKIADKLSTEYSRNLAALRNELQAVRKQEMDIDQETRQLFLRCFAAENVIYYQMFSRGHLSEQAYRDLTHSLQLQNESIRHFGHLPDYTIHSPFDRTSMDSFRNVRDNLLGFTGLPERWRINRTSRDYEEAWGRYQGSNEILADFDRLADADSSPVEVSRKVQDYYRSWNTGSKRIIDVTAEHFPEFVGLMQERLARRMMIAEERLTIEEEQRAGIIPSGVAEDLIDRFTRAIRQLRGTNVSDLRTDPRELLRKVPFFLQTPDQEFDKILPLLQSHTVPAGELIVKQGEHGSSMYLISRGVIRVVRSEGDTEKELASLLPGDFFGEIALLHDEPRTASCRAITPCVLYELTRADIVKIAEVAPSIKNALHEADKARKQSLEKQTSD